MKDFASSLRASRMTDAEERILRNQMSIMDAIAYPALVREEGYTRLGRCIRETEKLLKEKQNGKSS